MLVRKKNLSAAMLMIFLGCTSTSAITRSNVINSSRCHEDPKQVLLSCPTKRCLGIYLAPWCRYCLAAIPIVKKIPEVASTIGVQTCIIVGRSATENLQEFANGHNLNATLDTEGIIPLTGIPFFFSFDQKGNIKSSFGGVLQYTDDTLAPPEDYLDRLELR